MFKQFYNTLRNRLNAENEGPHFLPPTRTVFRKREGFHYNPLPKSSFNSFNSSLGVQHIIQLMEDLEVNEGAGIPASNVLSILDRVRKDACLIHRSVVQPEQGLVHIIRECTKKEGVVSRKNEIMLHPQTKVHILPNDLYHSIAHILPVLIIGCMLWWDYVPHDSREQPLHQYQQEYEQYMKVLQESSPVNISSFNADDFPERTDKSMALWMAGLTLGFALMIATAGMISGSRDECRGR
jgi:hypothetical protein